MEENNVNDINPEENEIEEIEERNEFSLKKEIFEWIYTIALAFVIVFIVKGFLFDIVKVDGESMYPTLHDGDRLIVTKLGFEPEQGEIVILDATYKKRMEIYENLADKEDKEVNGIFKLLNYKSIPNNLKKRLYVKRIIALEGQTVDLKNGKVYVDGKLLDEPYYNGITTVMDDKIEYPVTVKDDHVFVMGDNRAHSLDSRSSSLSQVPEDALIGESKIRFWPVNAFGLTK